MSQTQHLVLGVLGLAIVLVYGCLGAFALIQFTGPEVADDFVEEQGAASGPTENPPGSVASDMRSSNNTSGGVLPTSTRVVPLDGSRSPLPTTTVSAGQQATHNTDSWQPTPTDAPPVSTPPPSMATYSPTPAVKSPTPGRTVDPSPTKTPPMLTATVAPTHTPTPRAPAASPTPDNSCADAESGLHQQKIADIEAQYEPMLSWLEDEITQAERDRDDMKLEELRIEYQMYQDMKAADLSAENERHAAALAACAS
jgi:hypothetical protein